MTVQFLRGAREPVEADAATFDPDESFHYARWRPSLLWRYRVWMSGHARAVLGKRTAHADAEHLRGAARWLAAAQDAAPDGGVVGRYRLDAGWSWSYPETTGYLVPTFLALADAHDSRFLDRARRSVAFLLKTQLPNGAFPAGELGPSAGGPSAFNSAQIIHGLLHWYRHTGDCDVLAAARRASEWLLSVQESDGSWRRCTYKNVAATYHAYLSCWLADMGTTCGDARFLESASHHLDWVLSQRVETTGWFDRCAFTGPEHANRTADLHTIGYTLAGVLHTARVLGRCDGVEAVRTAGRAIAARFEELDRLPGVFDWQWRPRADSSCVTGNAQMALVWMELHHDTGDRSWLDAAYRAVDHAKRTQFLDSSNPGLCGGLPGADPLWGHYNEGVILSWSAKFFIDALLRKAAIETPP